MASFGGEMGAAADIEVIKEQLGQVTGGLSEAFDTTLVSLIFSLCVMFPTSVMQKNEEDLLNKVDEYCNEYFLKRLALNRKLQEWSPQPLQWIRLLVWSICRPTSCSCRSLKLWWLSK